MYWPPTASRPDSPVAGRAYFITQGETIPVWDMINALLKAAHMEPVRRTIARPLALVGAGHAGSGLPALRPP